MPSRAKRSKNVPPIRTLGCDVSINHAAFVMLQDGELEQFLIVTDTKSIAGTTVYAKTIDIPAKGDAEARACARLEWWREFLDGSIGTIFSPHYVAIEDYAYSARQGAHQIGEVGGLLRLELWRSQIPFRKYTPGQIKLFAAHKGRAEKEEMVNAARDRWGADFTFLRPGKTKLWTSAEDAADAFCAARLLYTEILLRKGILQIASLHEQEVRVFNTVGRGEVNLLARDFIQRLRR